MEMQGPTAPPPPQRFMDNVMAMMEQRAGPLSADDKFAFVANTMRINLTVPDTSPPFPRDPEKQEERNCHELTD